MANRCCYSISSALVQPSSRSLMAMIRSMVPLRSSWARASTSVVTGAGGGSAFPNGPVPTFAQRTALGPPALDLFRVDIDEPQIARDGPARSDRWWRRRRHGAEPVLWSGFGCGSRVSLRAQSIMPATSDIWLIGCEFTGSDQGMQTSPLVKARGLGEMSPRPVVPRDKITRLGTG